MFLAHGSGALMLSWATMRCALKAAVHAWQGFSQIFGIQTRHSQRADIA